ncbi:MAG TPA: TadE family protein [Candidatus Dormibacteraeota bacterium]|nr:TadE family protein [Candidatus Dormibacteraeota bacterium]
MKLIRSRRHEDGQSLLETAVAMPLLLAIAFNLINLGYFWFMVLSLAAAPRQGVQYSTQGGRATTTTSSPSTTAVSNLVYENMTNAVHGATTLNTSVRVCTSALGVNSSTHIALCNSFGPAATFSAVAADPEAPVFVLNRVDVGYTVTPLIRGSAFNVVLPANMNFHRQVSMRSLY